MLFLAAHPRAAPWHPTQETTAFQRFQMRPNQSQSTILSQNLKARQAEALHHWGQAASRSPPAAEGLLRRLDLGMEVVRSRIDTFRTFSYISFSQATSHQYW